MQIQRDRLKMIVVAGKDDKEIVPGNYLQRREVASQLLSFEFPSSSLFSALDFLGTRICRGRLLISGLLGLEPSQGGRAQLVSTRSFGN